MLSQQKTQEAAQAYSLGQALSPTASVRLEPAGFQDLRKLANELESSSRVPGLGEAVKVQLEIQADHALLAAVKLDPHRSKKAKRLKADRLRARISQRHRQQQDVGFEPCGLRVGGGSWSQYDEDIRPASKGVVDTPRSCGIYG